MLHIFQNQNGMPTSKFGGSLLFNGLLCVFFGLAILAAPELLAYLVATILIILGASLLSIWWKIRHLR